MLITILYSLWILYTVGSLSFFSLWLFVKLDQRKTRKNIEQLVKRAERYKDWYKERW